MNQTYNQIISESKMVHFTETNLCSVIALSVAANLPYLDAYNVMKSLGRKFGKGVSLDMILDSFKQVGLKLENITKDLCQNKINTISQFERYHSNINATFVIFVKNHVLCWKNGRTEDYTANSRKRIVCAYYVQNPKD